MKAQRLCQCPMDHPFFNRWLPAGGHDSKLSGSWFSFCNGNKTWFQLHERWLGPPMSLSSIPREQYCEAESSRASRSNSGFIPSFGCFQRRKRKLFLLSTFFSSRPSDSRFCCLWRWGTRTYLSTLKERWRRFSQRQ